MTKLMQNFWETAYKQNIGKMLGICYRYVRDKQVAEDLAHDAFLNAIDKVSGFEGRGHFDAWLRKIVVNEALKYLRDQKQKEAHNEWLQYESEMLATEDETLAADFTHEELMAASSQLPEYHKLVFNLYVIDKFSHAEIAQELGISEGTSKSHLARARKKIRALLLEKENKKRAVLPLFIPLLLWNIDGIYRKAFRNFEIKPDRLLKIDADYLSIPTFNPSSVVSSSFISSGAVIGGVAVSLTLIVVFSRQEPDLEIQKEISSNTIPVKLTQYVVTQPDNYEPITIDDQNISNTKNSDTTSATISDNAIITDENNINNTEMKRLSTVGALLMAGASMGFDSSKNLTANLSSRFKLPDVQFQAKKDGFVLNRKEGEGTFNASKIVWSSKNHYVYMKGINMRAKFEKDNFNATGTVSFLGEVYYLLIDGQEAQLDKDIKLSDNQYSVKSLSIKESIQKYGDKGKNGAVEIVKL
ncbi:RNA polymerase sigma factor [Emticicia fluvialis]|uniref:RNA polymerase sigma factor n=1 Tax=Emticicia fluvialis TaxID=2974474 RepID=UPI0021669DED|nr:RNA polymerase sigma factor [Emticicia fluvialis]